mmetsp:Transcript_21311/g.43774  ORF Transcript_21311/g.43774 Transcript_21311/m.43774 type:complete len:473 (+) Transcript_21311:335-1753(+)
MAQYTHIFLVLFSPPTNSQEEQESIMQTEQYAIVGVGGADRRFRCCGRGARSGIASATVKTAVTILGFLAATTTSAFSVEQRPNAHGIHRIVFGTAALSKAEDPLSLLDAAYEKGFRRFDLAHTYGAGESERIFGKWLSTRESTNAIDRSNLDIITKGGIGDDKYGDPDRPLLTRQALHDEIQESLDALHTDFVDLYMFHRDDPRIPVEHFVDWINEAVGTGKIKRWGVSNWNFDRFKAAHEYAKSKGLVPPSANSPQYSLAVPDGEVWPSTYSISHPDNSHEIDWYNDRGVELLCWEVLAKGFMAKSDLWTQQEVDPATFDMPVERGSDEWRVQRIQKAYCHTENYRRRNLAIELADSSGCNLAQVAMLYPLTRGEHISVIFGSSKADHLEDAMVLQHLHIDEEAMMLLGGVEPKSKDERRYAFMPQLVSKGMNLKVPSSFTGRAIGAAASRTTNRPVASPAFTMNLKNSS